MDEYIRLAINSINTFVQRGERYVPQSTELTGEMRSNRAGAFVSIHENGELRGCIGTIMATENSVAEEIVSNAIAAATRDPRFTPIQADELPYLTVSVDILGEPEPIASTSELDVKRYGLIVSKGNRRGLLLPNLEGVDTIDDQVAITKRKAGIADAERGVVMHRFEVIRHE